MSSVKILKQKKTPGGTATPGEVLCQVGDHSPGDGVDDQGPRPRPRPWSASHTPGTEHGIMADKLFFLSATPWKSVKNSKLKIEEKTRNIELAAVYCCFNQRGEKRQTV